MKSHRIILIMPLISLDLFTLKLPKKLNASEITRLFENEISQHHSDYASDITQRVHTETTQEAKCF